MADRELRYLADRPDAVPLVAGWLYDEWGHRDPDHTPATMTAKLAAELSREHVPIQIVAEEAGAVVGTAALKLHELRARFPELQNWLGSVYVSPAARGRGIAGALVRYVEQLAIDRGIRVLHLQTERLDGGLYGRMGYAPLARIEHRGLDVLVMAKQLPK